MLIYGVLSMKYEESTLFDATLWWPIYAECKNRKNSTLFNDILWWPIYAAEYKNVKNQLYLMLLYDGLSMPQSIL